MTKHAYLIMAHANFKQLALLVSLLDDTSNDIFIHIDAKAPFTKNDENLIKSACKHSDLTITAREAIYWGGFSQVRAELLLFKAAQAHDHYEFYHLLSGADLPIVSQKKMHHFFNDHKGQVFLSRMTLEGDPENINRLKYYHFFERFTPRTIPGIVGKGLFKIYRFLEVSIQKILRINLLKKFDLIPMKASQWVSLPDDVVRTLLKNEEWVLKTFGRTFIPDEVFLPIFLDKFGFNERIFNAAVNHNTRDEFQANLRFVNWWDGNPYVWTGSQEDRKELRRIRDEGYFFSRKFDLTAYPECRTLIKELLNE
ncbi:beta-1,6-N-acetylglucosaminyltransferase [Streptococcus dentasini]